MSALTAPRLRVAMPGTTDGETLAALLEGGYAVSRGGSPAPQGEAEVLVSLEPDEITGLDPGEVRGIVDARRDAAEVPAAGSWKPWFPVIDYQRCTDCMQCLSFCLFGVYGVDANNSIEVQHPDKCKTDCPACSRVCPEVAILFPKYRTNPLNGAPINEEDLRREAVKVDISAMLGGDIYQMLRDRSAKAKSRFSKERDDDRALKERKRCLKKLQEALDVPDEVLASLPSMAEIQAKADEAKARANEVTEERS